MAEKTTKSGKKYKASKIFDVDALVNFHGLGNENHARLCRGEVVELINPPQELIDNKMIEEAGGKK
jgi:hypothetical protein